MNGDQLTVTATPKDRPQTLKTGDGDLGVPSINVIPQTPISPTAAARDENSPATSGADEDGSDADGHHSSPYTSEGEGGDSPDMADRDFEPVSALLVLYRNSDFLEKSPEEFAQSHNMMLPAGPEATNLTESVPISKTTSVFSVDLGQSQS